MISELNDDEILDLLMTSEFENNLSPTEFKFLLKKWRFFYRLLHGRMDRVKDDLSFNIDKLKGEIDGLKSQNHNIRVDGAQKQDQIDVLKNVIKNRKLTWKERWTGKIITNEDEDK
jgi:FtsZ-binding cell division protein ZapB